MYVCLNKLERFTSSHTHTPFLHPPKPLPPPARPHYHNCVQNMRGRGSDHVILFTPCLALFTNDMPLTAKRTGARRHLLIRAVGAYQRRMAGNGYPVTNQISGRTESGPHLPGLHQAGLSVVLPADCAPRAQIRPAPGAWLPRDWLLALEMRVISAMTFLFRLDVCVWGGGSVRRNEGFTHSLCVLVYVCVCVHMHRLDCVTAQSITVYTYSFFFQHLSQFTILSKWPQTCPQAIHYVQRLFVFPLS